MMLLTRTFIAFPSQAPHALPCRRVVIRSSSDNGNNVVSTSSGNGNNIASGESIDSFQSAPRRIPPSDTLEIRFKRGSRKRRKLEEEVTDKTPLKQASAPKDWDSMTLSEKLVELYMGEKGMLFWLNKFAYASIFIVIGGWIAFRFVGPALNLYQLDTPPLSPTSIFK